VKFIGRPNDFIDVLKNNNLCFNFDCVVLSCHGDNGKIKMPVLGDSIYESNEPRGDFTHIK